MRCHPHASPALTAHRCYAFPSTTSPPPPGSLCAAGRSPAWHRRHRADLAGGAALPRPRGRRAGHARRSGCGPARGDELVLHGYTHLDSAAPEGSLRARFLRGVYTQREGEFAALTAAEARMRIELGLAWFRARGWEPSGFVPPAWLLGQGSREALAGYGFSYTTTFTRFHLLPERGSVFAPSLVYAARNRAGRLFSPLAASMAARALAGSPLMRLSLHPPDLRHPRLMAHARHIVARALETRAAVTKAECAQRLRQLHPGAVRPGAR
ncbi:DUF2334 domain-containing protein [Massilia sp. Se16.2.3]|uniref:DUF2334 domain-containing protein n=1 Tax=Massilia sp. Se16.2.3 TaxID=2709303 RepID=UPI001E587DC1|nr:DUF2334 domain-containing protein [Massilia sp. Se16.2.3]